jgi:hypothetical protein
MRLLLRQRYLPIHACACAEAIEKFAVLRRASLRKNIGHNSSIQSAHAHVSRKANDCSDASQRSTWNNGTTMRGFADKASPSLGFCCNGPPAPTDFCPEYRDRYDWMVFIIFRVSLSGTFILRWVLFLTTKQNILDLVSFLWEPAEDLVAFAGVRPYTSGRCCRYLVNLCYNFSKSPRAKCHSLCSRMADRVGIVLYIASVSCR